MFNLLGAMVIRITVRKTSNLVIYRFKETHACMDVHVQDQGIQLNS